MREITIGMVLKDIRIQSGVTLRKFCLPSNLDPLRYSLIERDELKPNLAEYGGYLSLIHSQEKK